MRTLFIILVLLITILDASDARLAASIYENITKALTGKESPKVYLHGEIDELVTHPLSGTVTTCQEADVIIARSIQDLPKECADKILFGNSYRELRSTPQMVGAFFWSKGRPNIVFYQQRLQRHAITLGDEYTRYIEE